MDDYVEPEQTINTAEIADRVLLSPRKREREKFEENDIEIQGTLLGEYEEDIVTKENPTQTELKFVTREETLAHLQAQTQILIDHTRKLLEQNPRSAEIKYRMLQLTNYQTIAPLLFGQKRIILYIDVHGDMLVRRKDESYFFEPHTFIMPDGIQMKYAPLTSPGYNCFSNKNDLDYAEEYIAQGLMKKILGLNFRDDQTDQMICNVSKQMISDRCSKKASKKEMKDFLMYKQICDSEPCRVQTVIPGTRMVNYFYEDSLNNLNDNYILLFIPGQATPIDVTAAIYNIKLRNKKYHMYATLKQIIAFFKRLFVEELIVFDSSCSGFYDENSKENINYDDPHFNELRKKLKTGTTKYGGKTKLIKPTRRRFGCKKKTKKTRKYRTKK